MGRKQNYYIFAPEKKKPHRAGCLILILSILFAGVVLAFCAATILVLGHYGLLTFGSALETGAI